MHKMIHLKKANDERYQYKGLSQMNKYTMLMVFFFSGIQAPISFAIPENHSFEESLGSISKNQSQDQSTNITEMDMDQSIETLLLMSPVQWATSENSMSLKKNNPKHHQKSLVTPQDAVNYRADALDFASPQLIAKEIATSQIHLENGAHIQTQATATLVESVFEPNTPTGATPLLNTDDTPEQWQSLANLYDSQDQRKMDAQSLPMIIQLMQWLGL
jgi:hypothetical protein